MEIFCTLVGYMNISRRKQGAFYFSINPPWKKLSLKTVGGDLEWELHNSLFSHEEEGKRMSAQVCPLEIGQHCERIPDIKAVNQLS